MSSLSSSLPTIGDIRQSPAQRLWWSHVHCVVVAGLLFAAASLNLASFDPNKTTVAADRQVMLKLAITGLCGLYGFWGVLTEVRVRRWLTTFPGAWLTAAALILTVASATSISPMASFAATAALWSTVLFVPLAMIQLGRYVVLRVMVAAMAIFLIGGWIAYLLFPALGHFQEPLSHGRLIDRFAGLSHPNTVGQFGGLVIVIMAALWIGRQARSWWSVLLVALAAGALVLSISRASMAACAIALVVANRDVLRRRLGGEFWLTMGIAVAAAALLFSLSGLADDLVGKAIAKLTKSGSTEELTTMTGRWSIWGETLRLSAERPLLGWGPATSKILLEEFAGYTHNLWLNGLLSGGAVCALVLVGLTVGRIRATFRQPQRIADGVAIFIICNGLFENVIFESIPAAPTMLLIVSMMWRDAGPEHSTPTDRAITEEST